MAQHIVLMNALAPLVAIILSRRLGALRNPRLGLATAVQLLLLWGWHAPPVLASATHDPLLHVAMQASLLAAASWFWLAVVSIEGSRSWQPITALLVTSKLFCLLGVLMVFAPRALYGAASSHALHGPAALADQQLAGLLMLVACPATYVLGGIIIAGRWFTALEREGAPARRSAAGA
jgi:putative membrane protein